MTTEIETGNGAPTGAPTNPQNPAPDASPPPQGDGNGTAADPPTFSPEQQAAVDRIVAERLKRERERATADQQARAKADADKAEAKRLEDEKKWEALARKHESKATELEAELNRMRSDQARRDAAQAAGIPQLWQRLQGETPEELADDAKALAAVVQPVAGQPGQPGRAATPPTPPAQAGKGNFVNDVIERQKKRATAVDPFESMMKR